MQISSLQRILFSLKCYEIRRSYYEEIALSYFFVSSSEMCRTAIRTEFISLFHGNAFNTLSSFHYKCFSINISRLKHALQRVMLHHTYTASLGNTCVHLYAALESQPPSNLPQIVHTVYYKQG